MNRYKKEEDKNRKDKRNGLTPEEIKLIDTQDAEDAIIQKLSREIHAEKFPEEYDFMYDSNSDLADRKKGKNPMNDEYIKKVSEKRKMLRVSQLSPSGMPESKDTLELCIQEAKSNIAKLRTRINEIIYYKWDPLQISSSNCPRDEYNSYVSEVLILALDSTSYHPISEYLTYVATEIMAMPENMEHDIEVARLIFSIAKDIPHLPDHTTIEVE